MTGSLLSAGYEVIGTMRDTSGRNAAVRSELERSGARIVEMDVTSDESVNGAIQGVLQDSGEGLDAVVNNAGMGVLGLMECFTPDDFRRLFEINVFGVQRVNRAILPHFRKKRKGLVVFISSLLGRMTVPFYGPYNASKWALEAMAENYRTELSGFGVDCAILEPGGFPTTFISNLMRPGDPARNASYNGMAESAEEFLKGFEGALAQNKEQDPQKVADALVDLLRTEPGKRPFRTIIDRMGMGEALQGYNENLKQITEAIYGNFGIASMLTLSK